MPAMAIAVAAAVPSFRKDAIDFLHSWFLLSHQLGSSRRRSAWNRAVAEGRITEHSSQSGPADHWINYFEAGGSPHFWQRQVFRVELSQSGASLHVDRWRF